MTAAAAHVADLHHDHRLDDHRAGSGAVGVPDDVSAGGPVSAGGERLRPLGGPGTPPVLEFAAAELGPRLGKSPYAARALMADALDVRHRLPRLWARVCAAEVPVRYARHVAQQTRELSPAAAGHVDAGVAEYADGRLGWTRFETLVAAKVVEADPDAAAARERCAAQEEFAKVGRSNDHGQKTLYVRSSAAAMVRIDATLAYLADALAALGDTDSADRRRAKAMLVLANPLQALQLLQAFATRRAGDETHARGDAGAGDGADAGGETDAPGHRFPLDPRRLLPSVTLYLHLYARTDTGEVGPVARWEGEGPVTTAYVRDLLGPACRFTVKPVIDLPGVVPVDGYEIPDRLREAVHLRSPADVFPFASSTARRMQLDHTRPYLRPDHGGPPAQTAPGNLGPMTQFHHRVKTHGRWQVRQPFPGVFVWRDPHGQLYLVDHTGTRRLWQAPKTVARHDPSADVTVDIHPETTGIVLSPRSRHAAEVSSGTTG